MGLDIAFDAFHGAYTAFDRFKKCIAWAIGGSYPPHLIENENGYVRNEYGMVKYNTKLDEDIWYFNNEVYDLKSDSGIVVLLSCASSSNGEINCSMCDKLAVELEGLLPKIQEYENIFGSSGHLKRDGGYVEVTKRFIDGCKEAVKAGKSLEFR